MTKRKGIRLLAALALCFTLCISFTVPAFAYADDTEQDLPVTEEMCIRDRSEPEAQRIATALEIYVHGSLNVFNHRTNVDVNNRFVCYDIKQLGKQLKKLGMLLVQDQVWNRVTINRAQHKATRYYMDEFHLLPVSYTHLDVYKRQLIPLLSGLF